MKAATASAAGGAGLVPAPAAGAQAKFLRGDGTWQNPPNTTYGNMGAATASAAGKAGLVPAPAAGAQAKFLRGDGTWQTPPDTNTVYTHPTTAGNKHIPAGGSAGQILKWSAAGTAVWGNYDFKTINIPKSGSSWTEDIGCYVYEVPNSGLSTLQALFITVSNLDLYVSQDAGLKLIACNSKGKMLVFVNKLPKNDFNLLYIPIDITNLTTRSQLWSNVITF